MSKSLEELKGENKPRVEEVKAVILEEKEAKEKEHMFEENEALIHDLSDKKDKTEVKKEIPEVKEPQNKEEISLELDQLSEKILAGIKDADQIISILNDITHDLTRGAGGDFTAQPINEQVLENGATVQMIDMENNGYRITYRKGILDQDAEVSFFLERENQLIFSVYLSSEGYGKISAEGSNGEHVVKQVNVRLNAY